MEYKHIDIAGNLQYILAHMDGALATLINNYEVLTEEQIKAYQDYMDFSRAYKRLLNENYINIIMGEEKNGENKKIATTAADKMAKALSVDAEVRVDQAKAILEGVLARKELELEKINICKRLIDSRTHLGG